MNWMSGWGCITKQCRCSTSKYFTMMEKDKSWILSVKKSVSSLQQQGGFPLERKTLWMAKLQCYFMETTFGCKSTSRRYFHSVQDDPELSRDFFVRLWVADRKKSKLSGKGRHKVSKSGSTGEAFVGGQTLFGFVDRSLNEKSYDKVKSDMKQPPTSQSVTGLLEPISFEESKVAPLLARSNLLITRDIEWANLVLGFEQENRYAIVDVCYPQAPVGLIREQSNVIARQLLRLRRPFIAYITDGLGNELFRVKRPFWWITSSIYAEINGNEIGVVHRRWHLWRRIYDLYLG